MTDVRGERYGEVLLVHPGPDGPRATVYNTYPLNDCPADLWSRLDADAVAREHGAMTALLNGPRHWLMDRIEKDLGPQPEIATFGGIEMMRQATVNLSSMNPAPYVPNAVSRDAVFVFDAGKPLFELIDPQGRRWVMQTWSQVVDRALAYNDLPGLATRLQLPQGWTYRARTPEHELRIDTVGQAAQVLQDDLTNSYSLARWAR